MSHSGEWAAMLTAVCWTVSATAFSAAGSRIGSIPVNVFRMLVAMLVFAVIGLFATGSPLPLDVGVAGWLWMLLSGAVGFFFGDLCLFRAFVEIGPRLSLLIMSLAPPLTALLAAVCLGERLSAYECGAMAVTLTGIAWVVTERGGTDQVRRFTWRGGALAFGGALGQAMGMTAAKFGLATIESPLDATAIRVLSGTVCFVLFAAVRREGPRLRAAMSDRVAVLQVAVGAVAGPVAGVWLAMYALTLIPAGLAQTFAATTPVLIIPVSHFIHRERITARSIVGAIVAFAGVALLFR
jgi:drug/metabolite transporter (DMT)-like permease